MIVKKKKWERLNPDDFEPITMDEFGEMAKKVLLKPVEKRAKYENKKPAKAELERKYRLKRR